MDPRPTDPEGLQGGVFAMILGTHRAGRGRATYGLGVVTPYAGVSLSDGASRTLRTGLRWKASQRATVALEATREDEGAESAPTNAVMLRASIRF